jgi:hypothetical protein
MLATASLQRPSATLSDCISDFHSACAWSRRCWQHVASSSATRSCGNGRLFKFGQEFTNRIRRRLPQAADKFALSEVPAARRLGPAAAGLAAPHLIGTAKRFFRPVPVCAAAVDLGQPVEQIGSVDQPLDDEVGDRQRPRVSSWRRHSEEGGCSQPSTLPMCQRFPAIYLSVVFPRQGVRCLRTAATAALSSRVARARRLE